MAGKTEQMNLCGIKCPLNWAKAKVRLDYLEQGAWLELIIDDPKGRRDIPRAAEAEGYAVIDITESDAADTLREWRIVIER